MTALQRKLRNRIRKAAGTAGAGSRHRTAVILEKEAAQKQKAQ